MFKYVFSSSVVMEDLTHMIKTSIELNNSETNQAIEIESTSHQRLLKEYVKMLDSKNNSKNIIKRTVDDLYHDYHKGLAYTKNIFKHCYLIALESNLLDELLVQYMKHEHILYDNLRPVILDYHHELNQRFFIDSRYINNKNIKDFEKMVREGVVLEFTTLYDDKTFSLTTLNRMKKHLGVIPVIRLTDDDTLSAFLDKLDDVDKHELSYYFDHYSDNDILQVNMIFTSKRADIYQRHNIMSDSTVYRWAEGHDDVYSYLYDHTQNKELQRQILKKLMNIKDLKVLPKHINSHGGYLQSLFDIYFNFYHKGGYYVVKNLIYMTESYLNDLSSNNSDHKEYINRQNLKQLDNVLFEYSALVKQSEELKTLDIDIADKLRKNDHIVVKNAWT